MPHFVGWVDIFEFRVFLSDYRVEQHFSYLVVSHWEIEAGREAVTRRKDVENVFFL